MKKLLLSKSGVTVLEGLIALGLLSLVAGGAFGVLLAASRQNSQPDIREEMVWAVEKANTLLKAYTEFEEGKKIPDALKKLCDDPNPLNVGSHDDIKCLLPPICDPNHSKFEYYVTGKTISDIPVTVVTFNIQCNGYEL